MTILPLERPRDGRGAHPKEDPPGTLCARPLARSAILVRGCSRRITTMLASLSGSIRAYQSDRLSSLPLDRRSLFASGSSETMEGKTRR
jgi:hypothetical protein